MKLRCSIKQCKTGFKAYAYIAIRSSQDQRAKLKQIVKNIEIPEVFTANFLPNLAKNSFLDSTKGQKRRDQNLKEKIALVNDKQHCICY